MKQRISLISFRVKREYSESAFQDEINDCVRGRCTLMKCSVGPLLKDESVIFRIRSRLVTETQIKVSAEVSKPLKGKFCSFPYHDFSQNYADKVQISSKLVARITRLPYQSPTERVSYEVSWKKY